MTVEDYVFDEDGDLILCLSRPADQEISPVESLDELMFSDSDNDDSLDDDSDPLDDLDYITPKSKSKEVMKDKKAVESVENEESLSGIPKIAIEEFVEKEPDIGLRMIVSSKHLILISPVFKAMLRPHVFKEGRATGLGKVAIPLPDDDWLAMIVILYVIHGKTNKVPRQMSLKVLKNIAVLVEKYQILEVMAVHADLWLSRLLPKMPTEIVDSDISEVLTWLSITWVFRRSAQFRELSRLLERRCDHEIEIDINTRPIPNAVIEAINTKRREALTEMYSVIKAHLEMYKHTPVPICDRRDRDMAEACDSMLLGSLYKGAIQAKIYPTPPVPYTKIAFRTFANEIQRLKVTSLCDKDKMSPPASENVWGYGTGHGFSTLIKARIEKVENRLKGLDIADYVEPEKSPEPSAPQIQTTSDSQDKAVEAPATRSQSTPDVQQKATDSPPVRSRTSSNNQLKSSESPTVRSRTPPTGQQMPTEAPTVRVRPVPIAPQKPIEQPAVRARTPPTGQQKIAEFTALRARTAMATAQPIANAA